MKKEMLLPYKFPFLVVVAGAALLALVWNVETAWISWGAGIVAVLLIWLGLLWINIIANAQYEASLSEDETKTDDGIQLGMMQQKMVYYSAVTLATILIYTITISGGKVENFLNWKRFILEVLIIGGVAGFATAWLYNTKCRIRFDNHKWNDHLKFASFIIPLLGVLHFSIWYNHLQPSKVSRIAKGVVTSDGDKYVHIAFEQQEQRFSFGRGFNETLQEGDSVLLTIKEGALGYPFASRLSRIK